MSAPDPSGTVTRHTIPLRSVRLKALLGLAIPLACAALFVRLGVWQVERHGERTAYNATVATRLAEAMPNARLEVAEDDIDVRRWPEKVKKFMGTLRSG